MEWYLAVSVTFLVSSNMTTALEIMSLIYLQPLSEFAVYLNLHNLGYIYSSLTKLGTLTMYLMLNKMTALIGLTSKSISRFSSFNFSEN